MTVAIIVTSRILRDAVMLAEMGLLLGFALQLSGTWANRAGLTTAGGLLQAASVAAALLSLTR
jgi:hypothetical protein